MQGKSIRDLVNEVSESVPGTLIATIGLGLAIFTYEMNRMSSFQNVESYGSGAAIPNFCVILVLLVLATVYIRNTMFRLHRLPIVGFAIAGAIACCILLQAGSSFIPFTGKGLFFARILVRICEALLLLCWIEVLSTLPARKTGVIIALSILVLSLANGISAFFKDSAVFTLLSFLPLLSMACLYWFKDKRESLDSVRPGENLRSFDTSLWPRTPGRSSYALVVLSFVFPLFGYTFLFGYIHFLWLPSQDGGQASMFIQLGAALGTLLAGWFLLLLIVHFWGRRQLRMYNLFILPILGVALYLTSLVNGVESFLYVIPLNVCQKLVLFLAMLSPFFVVSQGSHIAVWCVTFSVYTLGKALSSLLYEVLDSSFYSLLVPIFAVILIVAAIASVVINDGGQEESRDEASGATASVGDKEVDMAADGADGVATTEAEEHISAPSTGAAIISIAHEYRLTRREEEILHLLAQGLTASAIAEELVVSTSTAKTHMRNIYMKLGIHTQNELLLMVHRAEQDGES